MRAVLLALVLAAGSASAQRIRLSGPVAGGGSAGPSARLQTIPAASPAALGSCAALSGAYASATPVTETQTSPFYCGGVTWRRIWTDEEGVTASPDKSLAAYTFVSQAMAGAYAFKANNRAIFDFGDGINDECVSLGSSIQCGSMKVAGGQSFMADIIAPSTTTGNVTFINAGRFWLFSPTGNATCSAGTAGGLQGASADGNRPRWCDGTAAYRIKRVIPATLSLTIPSLSPQSESTLTGTVTGAAVGEHVTANMACDIPMVTIRRIRVSAANTVSIVFGNADNSNANPSTATACDIYVEVSK